MQLPGQQACAAAQGVVQHDRKTAVGRYKIQRTFRNFCVEHFFQAQRLRAKLNFIFLLVAQGAVLVFNGVKLYGEIRRRDSAARCVAHSLDAVTFAAEPQRVGKHRVFVQFHRIAAFFHPLCVYTLMLGTALGGVAAFGPKALIQKQRGPPGAVAKLRKVGQRQILGLIHG